jgi:hypothetical protein
MCGGRSLADTQTRDTFKGSRGQGFKGSSG